MKQVKLSDLVVYQGPDDAAYEYAAGLVRQISDDPYTMGLAAEVARGERDALLLTPDIALSIEDTDGDADKWVLAPTGVWQTCLSQLEMIGRALADYDAEELSADDFVEAVREQIGEDVAGGAR